jgi:hypothetical protein
MRTITYRDEAASWSRSNHLMGARLFPSSDNSDNDFSRIFSLEAQKIRTEIMTNQVTPVSRTV